MQLIKVLPFLLLPTMALAQQGPPTEQDILAATIGNLFKENARLAIEVQRLQAALAAQKAASAPPPEEKK